MNITADNTLILVIDIQERLLPVLQRPQEMAAACRTLLNGSNLLGVPAIITEQYPKGLGQTVADVRLLLKDAPVFEKTQFSALTPEVQAALNEKQPENVVLIGCEAHVCVLQTALQLRAQGKQVYIPQECVSSRTAANVANAFAQIQAAGGIIGNIESLLFQMLQDAKHPHFKAISKLIQ